jgi:EAL domain-containing protein (putative c-di-GMP-specific phosphodiesterase class I)/ActR/RegA family two-component response regulator
MAKIYRAASGERTLSGPAEPRGDDVKPLPLRRLLVLDDDDAVRRTVVLMVTRLGASVEACSTLEEFDDKLRTFVPDVLLIDLMMPEVDGIEVISHLGPQCDAAIYVMTGADKRTFEASREVLRSSGLPIAGFLQKPFTVADLRGALDRSIVALPNKPRIAEGVKINLLSPADLEKSARNGDVGPFFQPIMAAATRQLKGFEALLRIKGQSRANFLPTYLDYLANDDALSTFITDVVIDRSLDFLAGLDDAPELTMAINIFGTQAMGEGFRKRLVERCAHYAIMPHRVTLELSEATVCNFSDEDLRRVTQLRLAGFGLSIDDFGTGNSSLARLGSLPFSELKIDKSFCLALPASEPAEVVVEACLGIAHKLDMKVTAEGIENVEVAEMLTRLGCDALQGYYFARAMPSCEVIDWMRQGCPPQGV